MVTVDNGTILLDGRLVKTPGRMTLQLPTSLLAEAVADEWRAVGSEIKPHEMPLTGLANAAVERAPLAETLAVDGALVMTAGRASNLSHCASTHFAGSPVTASLGRAPRPNRLSAILEADTHLLLPNRTTRQMS